MSMYKQWRALYDGVPGATTPPAAFLPYPYTAIACRDADTAHESVRHRVLLTTPLCTHADSVWQGEMPTQIELCRAGPGVQADNARLPVALAGKDIDHALRIRVRVGAVPPQGGVLFAQGDVPFHGR